ncbi:IS66 family transposase [Leptothrix discophora]|uniref:IS66 family transposase n=1 Tax=Leptothrix discophora TaxID=89 RepID=UPI00387E6EEA
MLDIRDLKVQDLQGLAPEAVAALAQQMLRHIEQQAGELQRKDWEIERKDRELALREARLEKVQFELARLKRWKFGAKTETMSAEQRRLFEETLAEDEASLQTQLDALRAQGAQAAKGQETPPKAPPRRLRRRALPEHLRRVEHRHEPEDTTCPSKGCGRPMTRIGEDISEKLDIVPAEFFVHRHIYGKWACRCCQTLKQQASAPEVIDGGLAASGLLAHTLICRFSDHLPYYRQEAINARSGVRTPRSTLAAWAGQAGAALQPLYDAHKRFVLASRVLHGDETPVALLDPGAGKARKAYVWAYARSHHDPTPGVVYDFCPGRGAQYPRAFLAADERAGLPAWAGTLLTDRYGAYDAVLDEQLQPGRRAAACVAHARRKFDELAKAGTSAVGEEAIQRFASLYAVERALSGLGDDERSQQRQLLAKPLWEQLGAWLQLERRRVADGGSTAAAIDYTLKHWAALTHHLDDGAVPIDNNHLERQIKPWAMGRKAWMFVGSELAGHRAAVVMRLVQSSRMCGHEPWA